MKLARAAGLHVEQACFDGVGYVFQFHAGVLAEADQSLRPPSPSRSVRF